KTGGARDFCHVMRTTLEGGVEGVLDGLADLILRLCMHRDTLKRWSRQGRAFATEHTFDATFERRAHHVAEVAGAPGLARAS
ncbi:MAG: hypothetical protein AAFN74_10530, partial [Myxococcota bacterium]